MNAIAVARRVSKTLVVPAGLGGRRGSGDAVILLYHRIGNRSSEIETSPAEFEHQLALLVESEPIVTIEDVARGQGGVAVTFDDGLADFHREALPLIVKYRVPVMLYLATGFVAGEDGAVDVREALTWTQLREAADTGLVTVGSHTHGHVNLARVRPSEGKSDMERSKALIEDRLQVSCDHFAYPWAVGSAWGDRAVRRLFRSAVLAAWKTNRAGHIDPHQMGRVPILRSDGQFFFRRKIRGELDGERYLYQVLGRGPWGKA